ncbi:MAG: TIGR04149 family rSAM-modified RiPP [Bacteroidales bacterium]|jgi:natural product precursor|nr:TIGR04149 family rSAM-modified RiPP [Bacteroidales bacterium]
MKKLRKIKMERFDEEQIKRLSNSGMNRIRGGGTRCQQRRLHLVAVVMMEMMVSLVMFV